MIVGRIVNGQYVSEAKPTEADQERLRDMLASRQGPTLRTDSTFMEGHCNGNQFSDNPDIGDHYAAEARAQGVDITGAVYKHGLASYPGDPRAWVRSRGDVEAVARERGMKVDGAVRCDYTGDVEPAEDIDIAPDIVEQRVLQKMAADPSIEHTRKAEDVYAEAKDEIKPPWTK